MNESVRKEVFRTSTPDKKAMGNYGMLKIGKLILCRKEYSSKLSNTRWPIMRLLIYRLYYMDFPGFAYLFRNVSRIKGKENMNLIGNIKDSWKWLHKGKGKRKIMWLHYNY